MISPLVKHRSATPPSAAYERLKVIADFGDHGLILEAIRRRHPDGAERIMRRHIRAMGSAQLGAFR